MFNVLIVEDEKNIRKLIEIKLKNEGFNTFLAENGLVGLDVIASNHIDIMLVDAMMPKMDGYEFVKTARDGGFNIPAIMVTARASIEDKEKAYALGIDDYMVKSNIDFKELVLRIKAVMRRAKIVSEKKIVVGNIVLDYETLTVSNGELSVGFTKKEFGILYKLMSYPERSFSKRALFEEFWSLESETEEDAVKVYINRIRSKIADFKNIDIETVRGIGYRGVRSENNA